MASPTGTPDAHPRMAYGSQFLKAGLALIAIALLGTCAQRPGVLEQVRLLGVLKVATRNSPTAYFLGAQGPEGPEFELATQFARRLGVPAQFVILPSPAAVLEEVATGRAHLGAAGLAITSEWARRVTFSRPYQEVRLHVVHRQDRPRPERIDALAGHSLAVVAGSSHAQTLRASAAGVPGLHIEEVRGVDTLDLLDRVWSGELDATIADTNEFSLTRNYHPELHVAFNLDSASALAWALPRGDRALLTQVDAFLVAARSTIAALVEEYFAPSEHFTYAGARSIVRDLDDRLPPLRPYFEASAREFTEDWRVLAAIGYQESRWDPDAVSPTGVKGVMMLTADTATALGVENRSDPAQSIRGGALYLQQMRDLIPERIPEPDRTWLALAAYNVGYGHLEDARILAQSHGKDPDSWQEVREFLPLLSQERYYANLKRGYARGWEAARFVDNVRSYLSVLEWVMPDPGLSHPSG